MDDKESVGQTPNANDDASPVVNPYATPASELKLPPVVATAIDSGHPPSVGWILLWTLLVPGASANLLFWGYVFVDNFLIGQAASSYGINLLFFLFIAIPLLGSFYGAVVGWWLHRTTHGQSSFTHPVVQIFFQPFWTVVSVTAGCFAALPML